jgi:hypothetical protein
MKDLRNRLQSHVSEEYAEWSTRFDAVESRGTKKEGGPAKVLLRGATSLFAIV